MRPPVPPAMQSPQHLPDPLPTHLGNDLPSHLPSHLKDSFGRRFSYLRLSLTDACNFRCTYCLPNGYLKGDFLPLTLSEIQNLCAALTELGMWKIRLTGGEPTLRRDLLEIIRSIRPFSGIRKIALSTNGYRLKQLVEPLLDVGVNCLNVSVDSLHPELFHKITGMDYLSTILEGIDLAVKKGFPEVKINVVILIGLNETPEDWIKRELAPFLEWIRNTPIVVRLIELMPTGKNQNLLQKFRGGQSSETIRQWILKEGWTSHARAEGSGPAVEFSHPNYQGKLGIIAPYSKDFCSTCNRLRVTSRGDLRLCLFGEGGYSLRSLLQSSDQKEELKNTVRKLVLQKEPTHYLTEGRYGNNQTFSAMGG